MKTKHIFALLGLSCVVLFSSLGQAADITATGSGNWSSTTPDAPWPGGILPGTNDSVDVPAGITITVDTDVTVGFIYDSGTVIMAPNKTLTVLGDANGAYGTQTLGSLIATATGNTVIYLCNCFHAKRTDYYNLVFNNPSTNKYDFYNGPIPGYDATPMTISGDMSVIGTNKVQQGADIYVGGNLLVGTNSTWDCSSFVLTVKSNTTLNGLLIDLDGALGLDDFQGGVTVLASPTGGWNISDVTQWQVGASLTNNGRIAGGKNYGCITFYGTGIIAGTSFTIPTFTNRGNYKIATTITCTTNTPTMDGTFVFDLARTNQIVLQAGTNWIWYSGALNVINTGPAPLAGQVYKFFSAVGYGGAFASTSFPSLPGGLSWIDNTLTTGSIDVAATAGSPVLAISRNNGLLTLSWDSATFPGYQVQAQTNSGGLGSNWAPAGSGRQSPFVLPIDPANPAVFFRLSNP